MITLDINQTFNLWELFKKVAEDDSFDDELRNLAEELRHEIETYDEVSILESKELPF